LLRQEKQQNEGTSRAYACCNVLFLANKSGKIKVRHVLMSAAMSPFWQELINLDLSTSEKKASSYD
jgi:hypothetical protein